MDFVFGVLNQLTLLVVSWATVIGGLYILFDQADKTIQDPARRALTAWIRSIGAPPAHWTLTASMRDTIDAVFGLRALSFRFLTSTAVFSGFVTVALLFGWWAFAPDELSRVEPAMLVAQYVVHLLPMYLAILKTRWLVSRNLDGGSLNVPTLIVWDLVLTFPLYTVLNSAMALLNGNSAVALKLLDPLFTLGALAHWKALNLGGDYVPAEGLLLLTPFATSFGIWLFAGVSMALRGSEQIQTWLTVSRKSLVVDEHPFSALGTVAIGFVTFLFALAAPLIVVLSSD